MLPGHLEQQCFHQIPSHNAATCSRNKKDNAVGYREERVLQKMLALLDKSNLVPFLRKRQNHTDTGTRLSLRFSELAGTHSRKKTNKRKNILDTQSPAHQGSAEV